MTAISSPAVRNTRFNFAFAGPLVDPLVYSFSHFERLAKATARYSVRTALEPLESAFASSHFSCRGNCT